MLLPEWLFWAGVAQLAEHLICNQRVGGSNPFASSRVQSPGLLQGRYFVVSHDDLEAEDSIPEGPKLLTGCSGGKQIPQRVYGLTVDGDKFELCTGGRVVNGSRL